MTLFGIMIASELLNIDKLFDYLFEMEIFLLGHNINYTYIIYVLDDNFFKVEITTYDN